MELPSSECRREVSARQPRAWLPTESQTLMSPHRVSLVFPHFLHFRPSGSTDLCARIRAKSICIHPRGGTEQTRTRECLLTKAHFFWVTFTFTTLNDVGGGVSGLPPQTRSAEI